MHSASLSLSLSRFLPPCAKRFLSLPIGGTYRSVLAPALSKPRATTRSLNSASALAPETTPRATILYFLYYTIPYIPYYTILYYTILYYTILYYTILYYTMLYHTMLYYTILYHTKLYQLEAPAHCPVALGSHQGSEGSEDLAMKIPRLPRYTNPKPRMILKVESPILDSDTPMV